MTTQQQEEPFRRRPSARRPKNPTNIEQTLASLNIDTDLEPELAAIEAANALVQETHHIADVSDVQPRFTKRSSDAAKAAEKTERVASDKKEAPIPAAVAQEPETSVVVTQELEEEEVDRAAVSQPFAAPPQPIKARVQKPSPTLNKLGISIAAMMPGAERIRVEKRLPNGVLGYICDYAKHDLAGHPDLQSFLTKYVKPAHGAGEYKVTGFDPLGKIYEAGSVHLLDPPSVSEGQSALGLMQSLMAQQKQAHDEQIKELKANMSAQPSPVTVLREMHNLNKEIAPPAPPSSAGESTLAAIIASSSQANTQMMQMMMTQMQNAQQASQQQTAQMLQQMQVASQQQMTMFMEMFKQKEAPSSKGDAMPIPPPPPPANPLEGVKEIVQILADVGAFGGGAPAQDETKELLKSMVMANTMGVKDIIELMKSTPSAKETDAGGFKAAVDNMAVIMNMANQLKQNTEGSPSATIWDAVAALVSNRDFAGSIASAIRVNTEQVQRQTQTQQRRIALQEQQAMQLAAQRRQQQQLAQQQAIQASVAAPARTQPAPVQAQPQAAVQGMQSQQIVDEQAANEAKSRLEQNKMTAPSSLPQGIENQINEIISAVETGEEASIVEATVELVIAFHAAPEWTPFATKLLAAGQSGNKSDTLKTLGGLLQGLVQVGLLPLEAAREVLRCVDKHFDTIYKKLNGEDATDSDEVPEVEDEDEDEPVFVVPDPSEIDHVGTPLDEDEEEEEEGEEEAEGSEDDTAEGA